MTKTIAYEDVDQLATVAEEILHFSGEQLLFAIYGDMGAGKTTLIKSMCSALGVERGVSSPTFSVINEYAIEAGNKTQFGSSAKEVYHMDFYRIEAQQEVFDMGYENYFFGSSYCFIEWPEIIESLLPERYVELHINKSDKSPDFREITLNLH